MRRRSIRFRITALAITTVAFVLAGVSVILVVRQREALTASLDDTLGQRSDDIIALLETGEILPAEFAASGRGGFVQLVGKTEQVLVSTPNLEGLGPLPLAPDDDGYIIRTVDVPDVDDDMFRVLTREVEGVGVLHVGTTYDVVSESTLLLIGSLAVTSPILLLILGGLVWWLVGRTLQSVEDICTELSEIGSTDLDRRVRQPGTEDEIDRLAATMNEMLKRLQISVDRQQRFVADASHELRSPLTRMRSELEVDLAMIEDRKDKERLESIFDEVIEMQRMVEDLLYLARADAGNHRGVVLPVDLDEVVLRETRRIQSHRRVAVDLSRLSGALVTANVDQLTRAVRNLLDNAERHASKRVTVELAEVDGSAVLVVTDDGPGIPDDERERIFERFARLDHSRSSATGGVGLGLAIAREIVESHQGSLTLASGEGHGASFEMRIPLAD